MARLYGSLDAALSMTPRQLTAALHLEKESRGREMVEEMYVTRVATNGDQKTAEKFVKDLTRG